MVLQGFAFLHGIRQNPFPKFTMTSSSFTTIATNLTDDSSSPYFLHNGDNPWIVLVFQLLEIDNYTSWSISMRIALKAKNKQGFIDGSLPLPSNPSTSMHDACLQCNNMVFSWIFNSISKKIAVSCIYIDTTVALQTNLQERFSQLNEPSTSKGHFIFASRGNVCK